jgi:electron transport complex protein RnfD
MKKLLVSPSPHIHGKESTQSLMRDVVIALLPSVAVSIYCFGLAAIKLTLIGVLACVAVEYIIAKYMMKTKPTICDYSAVVTGILLALNVPAGLPWWIMVIGCIVAIGVAKMSFGGLGQNLFNPALVGRVFLLISFPAQMTTWPRPLNFNSIYTEAITDANTGATPLTALKEALKSGENVAGKLPDLMDSLLGIMGGSLGEVCALALIIGGLFLICTKVITWHIPVSILATVALFAAATGWVGALPGDITTSEYVAYSLLTGGIMLGAFFMATDYVTSPMSACGKIIFGVGIGFIVMVIRTWGAYPEGMSFAILIMNACVPLLNKIRPRRFGERKKA